VSSVPKSSGWHENAFLESNFEKNYFLDNAEPLLLVFNVNLGHFMNQYN
jgi:hypothetical protein